MLFKYTERCATVNIKNNVIKGVSKVKDNTKVIIACENKDGRVMQNIVSGDAEHVMHFLSYHLVEHWNTYHLAHELVNGYTDLAVTYGGYDTYKFSSSFANTMDEVPSCMNMYDDEIEFLEYSGDEFGQFHNIFLFKNGGWHIWQAINKYDAELKRYNEDFVPIIF